MDKVVELVDKIEAAMRELADYTEEGFISACILDGAFNITSGRDKNGQIKLTFYRGQKQ